MVASAEMLPGGTAYIANMPVPLVGRIARSLHTVNLADSEVLASFALAPEGGAPLSDYRLSVDQEKTVYAAPREAYTVSLWSSSGESLACFERKDLLAPPRTVLNLRLGMPEGMPQVTGVVADVHVDAQGLLWVSTWVPKDDWRDNLIKVEQPDGPPMYTRGAPGTVYRNVVEVIDVNRGDEISPGRIWRPGSSQGSSTMEWCTEASTRARGCRKS